MLENLSDWIIDDLKKSGLLDETIIEMGIEDIKGKQGTERLNKVLGFSQINNHGILQIMDCYLIPYPYSEFAG